MSAPVAKVRRSAAFTFMMVCVAVASCSIFLAMCAYAVEAQTH